MREECRQCGSIVNLRDAPEGGKWCGQCAAKGKSTPISLDKQYRTRDGREVKIFMIYGGGAQPVLGVTRQSDGSYALRSWTADGRYWMQEESPSDLIEVRSRFCYERWVNVFPGDPGMWLHGSRDEARARDSAGSRIACVKVIIEGEAGEGL